MKIKLGKNKLIINPGSVGQPRNGSLNAHWASFNTKTMKVELKSTKYNKQRLVKQIKLYDKNKKNLIKFFIKKK
jgi:predicted phosphodiesterase